jgi:hypothetical protein
MESTTVFSLPSVVDTFVVSVLCLTSRGTDPNYLAIDLKVVPFRVPTLNCVPPTHSSFNHLLPRVCPCPNTFLFRPSETFMCDCNMISGTN